MRIQWLMVMMKMTMKMMTKKEKRKHRNEIDKKDEEGVRERTGNKNPTR